jgi:hypothetical protein
MPDHRNRTKLLISVVIFSAVLVAAAVAQRENKLAATPPSLTPPPAEQERSRAIFGEEQATVRAEVEPERAEPPPDVEPAPVVPEPQEQKPQPTPVAEVTKEATKEVPPEIQRFLERWRSTFAGENLQAHVETYAPRMELFFNRPNVSRDAVFAEKQRTFRMYPEVNKYEIHDVKLEHLTHDRAAVTFRKDWDMSGDRGFAGSERQRLGLRKLSQGWQIVREEELKVYWQRR